MNENIDLAKILKDCPEGFGLYSTVLGEVKFVQCIGLHRIIVKKEGEYYYFTEKGVFIFQGILFKGECVLFPSKEQRDWSKFTAPWYKKEPEHKFHVGQYITDGYVGGQITSIEDNYHCYKILDFMGGINTTIPFTLQDNYHLWTIQDAKDGDVLCCKSGWMCIFKSLNNHTNTFSSYCFMDSDKCFFNSGSECHTLDKKFINAYNGLIHPATKEQRDLLFQKIKEAGYKWNDETKTLEKLLEHKFDPKTLQPFDKVLTRDSVDEEWTCTLFSYRRNDKYSFICGNEPFVYCIPYNDATKHLIGTKEEEPEYYRFWKD